MSDNPTAQKFGHNDLTIADKRDIAPVVRGKVGGRYEKKNWFQISEEPAKKRTKVVQRKNNIISGGKIVTIKRCFLHFIKVDNCFSILLLIAMSSNLLHLH